MYHRSTQVCHFCIQMNVLELKCTFQPSNHSNEALFNSNAPSYSQSIHIRPTSTQYTITLPIYSNEAFFNSYVTLHLQTTQNKPSSTQVKCSSTQICFCILNTLKSSPPQLKCAFALPIYTNEVFFNSYVSLHPQII